MTIFVKGYFVTVIASASQRRNLLKIMRLLRQKAPLVKINSRRDTGLRLKPPIITSHGLVLQLKLKKAKFCLRSKQNIIKSIRKDNMENTLTAEITMGLARGRLHLEAVLQAIGNGKLQILHLANKEQTLAKGLPTKLNAGEREAIALSKNRKGRLLSNDQRAVRYCQQNNISVMLDIFGHVAGERTRLTAACGRPKTAKVCRSASVSGGG